MTLGNIGFKKTLLVKQFSTFSRNYYESLRYFFEIVTNAQMSRCEKSKEYESKLNIIFYILNTA